MSKRTTALTRLLPQIRELIIQARSAAKRTIDTLQVVTNFEIGRLIVEEQQHGTERAEYGKALLKELSGHLTAEFGRGFSEDNLSLMRRFYVIYRDRLEISETLSRKSLTGRHVGISALLARKSETASRKSGSAKEGREPALPFSLSWSHYVFLTGIKNTDERSFYEIEATTQGWPLRELRRQFDSGLYERLALSRDKDGVRELAKEGLVVTKPEQLIKDPYVLEFLGLREETRYSERELETAIIDKLEQFLLELGKGFLFEARQKRFTFDEEHFFVDLVFYNRLLSCYVLIDLKIGELTHQDLGQMQMYVNYYDRYEKRDTEHPTVGIILCHKKKDALVEITLPDSNIYASEYQLYLPSKEDLRQKLIDWAEEVEG